MDGRVKSQRDRDRKNELTSMEYLYVPAIAMHFRPADPFILSKPPNNSEEIETKTN